MENVVNLRQARKQKARAEKRELSDARTAVAGVKKPERELASRRIHLAERTLDGHKRDNETEQ